MQLRRGHLTVERRARDIDTRKRATRVGDSAAAAQYPRNKLELRDIVLARDGIVVHRIPDEIKPRHSQTALVNSVVIQRITVAHAPHAYHCIVRLNATRVAIRKPPTSRRDNNFLVVRTAVVERSPEIKIAR